MNENNNKEKGNQKEEEINNLKKQIQERDTRLEENKVRIGDFVKKIINFKKEKEILEKDKENLQKEKEKLEKEKENLQKEKDELEKSIKEIKMVFRDEFSNILKEKYEEKLKEEIQKFKDEFQNQIKFDDLEIMIKENTQNLIQKYKKIIEEKTNSNCKSIHNGVKCGKCFKEPIIGYRYKCYICDNFNLCENCEKENQISGEHKHDFIKIRNSENMFYNNAYNNNIIGNNTNINNYTQYQNINNINKNIGNNLIVNNFNSNNNKQEEINLGKNYSFECININNLTASIFEEQDSANISIALLNNGKQIWPEGITKLIFVEPSTFKTNDIILNPQKPGEKAIYQVSFNNLRTYPSGYYNSYLRFNINGVNLGQKLKLKTSIIEK